MYTTKWTNKNVSDITGNVESKYITIGDPYVGQKDTIPARWKSKQFQCDRKPQNSGGGYFGQVAHASELYNETKLYLKTQPLDQRKKGFGTRDANRRDEFAATIRTSQYRETLRKEQRLMDANRDKSAEKEMLETLRLRDEEKRAAEGDSFLYDIGRSKTTGFNPKSVKDSFYDHKEKFRGDVEKNHGPYLPSSLTVGEGIWNAKYDRPAKGSVSATKNFKDHSHLQVQGF